MIVIAVVFAAATAVGILSERRWSKGAERAATVVIRAMLWVLLPPVVFVNIVRLDPSTEVAAGVGFGFAALALTLTLAWLVGTRVLHLSRPGVGGLMLAAGFANTGYLGLPLTAALFGTDELPNAIVYDLILTTLGIFTIGFSIGAAFGTVAERPRERVLAFFARNPPLWASAAGLLAPASLAPGWALDASLVVVYALLPLGFFVVGVTLAAEADDGGFRFPPPFSAPIATALVLKLLVAPAVLLGLSAAIVDVPDSFPAQAAMASAINSIVIAHEYGLDRSLVASAIAWSTTIVVFAGLCVALL